MEEVDPKIKDGIKCKVGGRKRWQDFFTQKAHPYTHITEEG